MFVLCRKIFLVWIKNNKQWQPWYCTDLHGTNAKHNLPSPPPKKTGGSMFWETGTNFVVFSTFSSLVISGLTQKFMGVTSPALPLNGHHCTILLKMVYCSKHQKNFLFFNYLPVVWIVTLFSRVCKNLGMRGNWMRISFGSFKIMKQTSWVWTH